MDHIHYHIEYKMSTFSTQLETDPYNTISNIISNDFVYGSTSNDVKYSPIPYVIPLIVSAEDAISKN